MAQIRPTFSESWYRVADLKVKLRPSAQISRQYYRGDRWYVVRDPAGNQFHRLSAPAYAFVGLLDGTRTVAEAWELVGGQMADDAPTQNEVIQILSQLHSANLIEANVTADAAVLLRRHKKMVQRQWQARLMNVLFPRIPLWDADQFLCRWMPAMKHLLSPLGILIWLIVVVSAVAAIVPEWPRLQSGAQFAIKKENWPFLWATFVLIKAIHELGHGFICRRFGGEVHEMGVMFLVLVPAPYVDASTAWAFPNKWARIFVGAGGMIFELFVAAIMAFVWKYTAPDSLINQLAYNTMFIASVSTVVFNANPLLRYDGYYMLSDFLEIPNLRHRSSEYTLGLIKRHLFKVKLSQPLPPVGQRIWLLAYAITSTIYRTFVGIMIILMVWGQVPILGVLMAIGGVVTWLTVPIFKLLKYLLIDAELHRKRARASLWTAAATATAVVLLGFVPWHVHYESLGIVEPAEKAVVYAETPGTVDRIVAHDGQMLKKGDVILVLRDKALELKIAELDARMAALKARHDAAMMLDQTERINAERQMQAIQKALDEAHDRFARLTVRAPKDGQLVASELKQMMGKYIQPSEEVALVAQPQKLRVIASIDPADSALPFFREVKEVEVRLAGDIGQLGLRDEAFKGEGITALKAEIEQTAEGKSRRASPAYELPHAALSIHAGGEAQVDPTDPDGLKLLRPHTEMWFTLKNPKDYYVPGQRAHLRFDLGRETLFWHWGRRVWQVIQAHSNSKWL